MLAATLRTISNSQIRLSSERSNDNSKIAVSSIGPRINYNCHFRQLQGRYRPRPLSSTLGANEYAPIAILENNACCSV